MKILCQFCLENCQYKRGTRGWRYPLEWPEVGRQTRRGGMAPSQFNFHCGRSKRNSLRNPGSFQGISRFAVQGSQRSVALTNGMQTDIERKSIVKFVGHPTYEMIDQRPLECGNAAAWSTRASDDACWDSFLQCTDLGQYQQSSMWARTKERDGWKVLRVVLTVEGEIAGGFQLLWRSKWGVRIGYVSKGPVVTPGFDGLSEYALAVLKKACRIERLTLLIVQPADLCEHVPAKLCDHDFDLNVLTSVIEATWVVDLQDGFEKVAQKMRKETRQKAKQAVNRGIAIREGDERDLHGFFDLMLSTCQRQGVVPSPSSVDDFIALWRSARGSQAVRLFFAEYEGAPLSGLFYIVFGDRVSLWKRGWSSEESNRHPNDLGVYEGLRWASSNGYRLFDFCALDKGIAKAMLKGEALSPSQERSRHLFHIRFGGRPCLLPHARVHFPNPIFRFAYRVIFYRKLRARRQEDERSHLMQQKPAA